MENSSFCAAMPTGCAIHEDKTLLIAIADRRLSNPASSIADLVGRLGPEGRAVYDLIENRDPRLVPKLLAQLPGAVQQNCVALIYKAKSCLG